MIPSGKPHNQMILGPSDKEENKITGKGKSLLKCHLQNQHIVFPLKKEN